ncbi:S-layer homology domain-containing protein [Selenomonas ruminantium]|uniref:S-layer homology domain-containing protein n=1 Tax=Selenomonas ruminantium TaxID=971 RepID=A0A1I3EJT9_SELRU|nr:S-layer homology domain-containing protein [Selenomonas ruminantium]SFH98981.1 S-layer homology domain-containing protein [Selenomonas ruminantium]
MKKTLVSALTTALVVGAASTTFAAANPFSDVPADHWAYDAVAQLAADGVIDGYGDGTYRGDRNITRYEMAQMVAKAMAKNPSGADKALVDKLAAEFADELNNLGVRVANLERNADMVKWNGEARYTISRYNQEGRANDDHKNDLLLRLEPSAEVNNHWHVKARIDAKLNMAKDAPDRENDDKLSIKRVWAQGDYDRFQVKIGKFGSLDNDNLFDVNHTGVEVTYGKELKGTLGYARLNQGDLAKHLYVGANYAKNKLSAGASYHRFDEVNGDGDGHVWIVKAGYKFLPTLNAKAFYAKSNSDDQNKSAGLEINYKGAKAENKGSWGAWVAYRHIGRGTAPNPTWDVTRAGEKDYEIGANYTLFKNVVLSGRYGFGKTIAGDHKTSNAFARVQFFF